MKSLILLLFFKFDLCCGQLLYDEIENNDLNFQMGLLAEQIWNKSLQNRGCVVLIADPHLLLDHFKSGPSIFRFTTKFRSKGDTMVENNLVEAFRINCDTYVVQLSRPECFFKSWTAAREVTLHRHNPKILFLPVFPNSTEYGENLLNVRESEISPDILVAEMNDEDEDYPIKLSTNNFSVQVGTVNRTSRIFLDEWSPLNGFRRGVELYPDKTSDLQGKEIRLATFTYLPYINVDPFDGTEGRMMIEFCRIHSCHFTFLDDGLLWGTIYGNRKGDGLMGMVYTDKADIGVCANYLWLQNHFYLDYSSTYLYSGAALLVPKPVPLGGWRTPFLPFNLTMWLLFFGCLVVSSLGLYAFTAATIRYTQFGDKILKKKQFTSITDSIIRSLGMSVLQQPSQLVINSPVRHLFTSFEFLYLIMTSCYAAELASYLTVPQFTKPIDTYSELASSGLFWLADHEAWIYELEHSEEPADIAVVKHFLKTPAEDLEIMSPTGKYGVGIERLPGGHYSEQPHITEEVITNSHVMEETLFGSPITVVLQKGSPYTEHLNMLINRLLDAGIILFWEGEVARKFLTYRVQMGLKFASKKNKEGEPTTLTTTHIQGAFIIYGLGIFVSSCFFVGEIVVNKQKRNMKDQ